MNLGVASYITSAGLRAVTSGGSLGPYFALKYFIPFYDYRIDKSICREISGTTSALSISSLNLVSATHSTLFGEKIFADGDYQLSDSTRFLYWTSNMGTLVEGATNNNVISQQSVSTDVNLIYGKPLSNTVSGNTVTTTATGYFTVTNTNVLSGSELSQYNPTSAVSWPSSAFYKVASYSPNVNGITSATGSYKCRIPPGKGTYKFNGIAVYAVKVDNNGFDDSGNGLNIFNFNPTLFSVILFDQAQYKQETPGGINDFEISVDLGFDWNTVNPGSSAIPTYVNSNYWIKLPTASSTSAYAINYDGDVVISTSSVPGSWTPRAKLTVTEKGRQQLRLANDDTRYTDFRTVRFPIDLNGVTPNYNDRAVLSIDTSCPDDSLLQMGYSTTAMGIKSVAIGCYASATGYFNNGNYITEDFLDNQNVTIDDIRNDSGGYTVSIGVKSLAQGFGSWATGFNTSSIGYLNYAGGDSSIASYSQYSTDVFSDQAPKNGLNFTFGKYTSAISRTSEISNCGYSYGDDSTEADDESFGSNVAFGVRSLANGGLSFTHGNRTSATGMASLSFGYKNNSNGCFSFTQGSHNLAQYQNSWAVGNKVSAFSNFGLVFGKNSVVGNESLLGTSYFGLAIGDNVSAIGDNSLAFGKNVLSNSYGTIALGQDDGSNSGNLTVSTGVNSISIGKYTSATGIESIALGQVSIVSGNGGISIGSGNIVGGDRCIGIGNNVKVDGYQSMATNYKTTATGSSNFAMGGSTYAAGWGSLATGIESSATGNYGSFAGGLASIASGNISFAFGNKASATTEGSISLGTLAKSSHADSIAIGNNSQTTNNNQVMIGSCDSDIVIKGSSINIGGGCSSNVFLPGLKQFNDSIGYKISTGMETPDRYQMNIDFYRDGYNVSTITLVGDSLGYVTVPSFKITKITGTMNFKFQMSDVNGVGYKNRISMAVGGQLQTEIQNKIFNWTDVNSNLQQYAANFLLCFDDLDNSIIFYGNEDSYYTTPNNIQYSKFSSILKDTTDLSPNDNEMMHKIIYSVAYSIDRTWVSVISHRMHRIKNCNMLVGEFNGTLNYPFREWGRSNLEIRYWNKLDTLSTLDGLTSVTLYCQAYAPSNNSNNSIYVMNNSALNNLNGTTFCRLDFLEINTGYWYKVIPQLP